MTEHYYDYAKGKKDMEKHILALADFNRKAQISLLLILILRPEKSHRNPFQWGEKGNKVFSKAYIGKY